MVFLSVGTGLRPYMKIAQTRRLHVGEQAVWDVMPIQGYGHATWIRLFVDGLTFSGSRGEVERIEFGEREERDEHEDYQPARHSTSHAARKVEAVDDGVAEPEREGDYKQGCECDESDLGCHW